jgi:hypothetical protein
VRRHFAGHSALLAQILAWTVPAAAAAAVAVHQSYRFGDTNYGGDAILFVHFGQVLLSSHWDLAFSHSDIQTGPLQLLFFGSLADAEETIAVVLGAATALLAVAAARAAGVRNAVLLGGVGLLAVATGLTRVGYATGHPADAMLPLVWVIAADQARRDHRLRAGLLVGLCAGVETWGILGVAVFAFAPRLRGAAVSTLVAAVTAPALFAPFMLGGHFEMLSFAWHVTSPSPLSLVVSEGTPFGWPLRLMQAAVAVSAGVLVARALRHSPHALWAAPLAIVLARLLLDPLLYSYYLAAPRALILVGAAVGAARWTQLRSMRRESFALCPTKSELR